jgi:hypothetical protein
MTTAAWNPCRHATAEFDELLAAAVSRYGPQGQGVGLILYEQLVFLRQQLLLAPDSPVLQSRVASMRDRLNDFYCDTASPSPEHPTRVVRGDPVVIEFSREAFGAYGYCRVTDLVLSDTVALDASHLPLLEVGRTYLYVIDEQEQIKLWLRPFDLVELAFGGRRATINGVPVAHPMMVASTLRAMTAGEVIFVGAPEIKAVIANTKSGHFRPPPHTAGLVRSRFAAACAISRRDVDVTVFT